MAASPNDFARTIEENKKLTSRNRELVAENDRLRRENEQLKKNTVTALADSGDEHF